MQHLFQQLKACCPERAEALIVVRGGKSKLIISALRRMLIALGVQPYQGKNSGAANLWQLIKLTGGQPKLEGQSWCGADYVFPKGDLLGKGGFAQVFQTGGYALKCLDESKRQKKDLGEQEVAALCCLKHSNIVQLIDWWYCHGSLVLLTELIQGQSLRSLQGKLVEPQVLAIGDQLLQAIAYMHSVGYVHRDIKPSNAIWNSETSQLKVLDLGLTCSSAKVKQWAGTLAYMLPQIWRWHLHGQLYPRQLLEQGDVWAAIATLFTLLVRRPYNGVKQADELKEIFAKPDAEIVTMFRWRVAPCLPWLRQRLCHLTDQQSAEKTLADLRSVAATGEIK